MTIKITHSPLGIAVTLEGTFSTTLEATMKLVEHLNTVIANAQRVQDAAVGSKKFAAEPIFVRSSDLT